MSNLWTQCSKNKQPTQRLALDSVVINYLKYSHLQKPRVEGSAQWLQGKKENGKVRIDRHGVSVKPDEQASGMLRNTVLKDDKDWLRVQSMRGLV